MFRAAGQVEHRPRDVFANPRTREVNRQQAERTRVQFTSVEKRLADMDMMGIDIQAITPAPMMRAPMKALSWAVDATARNRNATGRWSFKGIAQQFYAHGWVNASEGVWG